MPNEKPEEQTTQSKSPFIMHVAKVIYAPHKAFKEIIGNPKYAGPILIAILFTASYVGTGYVAASKVQVEQILPASEIDAWTENITLWTSNVNLAESDDALSGGYYGNHSIQASTSNGSEIWMKLSGIGPVNNSDYTKMSFRIKATYPDNAQPVNASLQLFSSQTDYSVYNFTNSFSSLNRTFWNNFTIPLGPENGWTASGQGADWSAITGVAVNFAWSENADLSVRFDGLFFRGVFTPFVSDTASFLVNYLSLGFIQFFLKWFLFAGLIYVIGGALKAKSQWRTLHILVGFALLTDVVQTVISMAAYSTLPTIYYPLEFIGGVGGELHIAALELSNQLALVSQVTTYISAGILVWTVGLCAYAVRLTAQAAWTKSFLIATVAFFGTTIIEGFVVNLLFAF